MSLRRSCSLRQSSASMSRMSGPTAGWPTARSATGTGASACGCGCARACAAMSDGWFRNGAEAVMGGQWQQAGWAQCQPTAHVLRQGGCQPTQEPPHAPSRQRPATVLGCGPVRMRRGRPSPEPRRPCLSIAAPRPAGWRPPSVRAGRSKTHAAGSHRPATIAAVRAGSASSPAGSTRRMPARKARCLPATACPARPGTASSRTTLSFTVRAETAVPNDVCRSSQLQPCAHGWSG